MDIIQTPNVPVNVRDKLTLRQLRGVLKSTKGKATYSECWFRENPDEIFCRVKDELAIITIYNNGFFTYCKGKYTCVLRVDGFDHLEFKCCTEESGYRKEKEEKYIDEKWIFILAYYGAVQWEKNENKRNQYRHKFYLEGDDRDWNEALIIPCFLEELEEKEREYEEYKRLYAVFDALTERQQKIVFLRFHENLTQQEIAERLGIKQQSVCDVLKAAIKHLKSSF
ncbi:MAG: sigma-70 family RNA polymerase sigma factor [Oscillospiraceae bacterium]|nr:sigma-70 family RNA polymerase sigma factor [Oscillospiraceae bacterium]